jgi:hypothetical protein
VWPCGSAWGVPGGVGIGSHLKLTLTYKGKGGDIMRKMAAVVGLLMAMLMGVTSAHAALTFPAISLTDFDTAVGVILTAIGGLWIARKLIKLGNKS